MKASLKISLQAIAFVLAILLAPAATLADGFLDDDLMYKFLYQSDTEVAVTDLRNSSATHITIPSSVVYEYTDYSDKDEDGHYIVKHRTCRVTRIGAKAFRWCSGLTSVTIPDSVTSIGHTAFSGCSGLTSVTILGNVMDDYDRPNYHTRPPFHNCTNIASLFLGGKMTKIGAYMFYNWSGLTSVTIGNNVTNIESWAFQGCCGLASVTIGNSVTRIGIEAFRDCSALTSMTIPDSVTCSGGQGLPALPSPAHGESQGFRPATQRCPLRG